VLASENAAIEEEKEIVEKTSREINAHLEMEIKNLKSQIENLETQVLKCWG
jgi:hypothetical protein